MPERELTGIFGDQVMRLRRERWNSATELAEEIFAILNYVGPLRINNPITLVQNGAESPLTVLNRAGDTVLDFNGDGVDFGDFDPFPEPTPSEPPEDPDEPDTPTSATFPGKIVGGSGLDYFVDIYEQGHTMPKTNTVPVAQLQMDPQWSIPAGTWVKVTANVVPAQGATTPATVTYSMQVPVWLARPS